MTVPSSVEELLSVQRMKVAATSNGLPSDRLITCPGELIITLKPQCSYNRAENNNKPRYSICFCAVFCYMLEINDFTLPMVAKHNALRWHHGCDARSSGCALYDTNVHKRFVWWLEIF
jgi:hypothetical protein